MPYCDRIVSREASKGIDGSGLGPENGTTDRIERKVAQKAVDI